jgi:hypothetical protein
MEELSEIIHRGRNDYLIIRTARQLEDTHSDEVTDDLGINSDNVATNNGLKYRSTIIILHHLKVGVEETNQSSVNNIGAAVKISPLICLENIVNTIQRCHHNVRANHIPLGNDWAIHDLGSEGCSISLCPLADPGLWAACKHDSVKRYQHDSQK